MVGELFRNFCLACKVQTMINENVSLKGDVQIFFFFCIFFVFLCRVLAICLYPELNRACLYWPGLQPMIVVVLWSISAMSATLACDFQIIMLLL